MDQASDSNMSVRSLNPNCKLTWELAEEIRSSKETGVQIAKRLGISTALVSLVRSNRIWKKQ